MFYSHTFLGRKGPLGTVWCAAHLHHKLKKSHYTATHIPDTVERIIYPEVPIALRMSGHLLLGVVRIYSKKVEYLHHDCNVLWVSLRNAFRTTDVNLPENATQAPFNAVTLPETYALDAIDIEHDLSLLDESQDNHLRNLDEITLKDQFQPQEELYVRITFDDEIIAGSSHADPSFHLEGDPMQIDSPRVPDLLDLAIPDLGTSENREASGRPEGDRFSPPEILRDRDDFDAAMSSPILRPHVDTFAPEPNISKHTPDMHIETPMSVHTSSQLQLRQSPQRSGPSSPSPDGSLNLNSIADATASDLAIRPSPPHDLELRPSPPQSPERPPPRRRRRKQLFDEKLVLTNTFYKNAIDNYSDLVKKRKKLPCSDLEMWRHQSKRKIEQVVSEPLISGMCGSLQSLSSLDLMAFPNLIRRAGQPESTAEEPHVPLPNVPEETEHLRSRDRDLGTNFEQFFPSTPLSPPQSQGGYTGTTSPIIPGTLSEPRFTATGDTERDLGMFTETPMNTETHFEDGNERSAGLSDIPEWRDSDELSFLEQDNNSPTRGTMSVRTRVVAEYLTKHSPSSGGADDVSLNGMLEGRRRKVCARMFYETLVLKSLDKIEVKQEEAYGEIRLKLKGCIMP